MGGMLRYFLPDLGLEFFETLGPGPKGAHLHRQDVGRQNAILGCFSTRLRHLSRQCRQAYPGKLRFVGLENFKPVASEESAKRLGGEVVDVFFP